MQQSQFRKCLLKSKTEVYIQRKIGWIQSENRIKNIKGWSTSSEAAPEYFGTKRRLSLKISGALKYHVWYSLSVGDWQQQQENNEC